MNRKQFKKCVIGSAAAVALMVAGVTVNHIFADEKQDDTILDNIYIGDIAVGGMKADEASQAIGDYVDGLLDEKFNLKVNEKSLTASGRQLGLEWENTGIVEEALTIGKSGNLISRYKDKKDLEHEPKKLEISFRADETQIEKFLSKNKGKLNQKAKDGGLIRENGAFQITKGQDGIAVNEAQSAKAIAEYIENEWKVGSTAEISLIADVVQPRGSEEQLSKVKDVLATFSTDYSTSAAGRVKNVETGCGKINGTVLYPGDEFSVYKVVAPFDEEHGYALAGSFENGTVVETYGGGICQVSTTLYNAVIRAELEVKERFEHSMIVTYVEPSMDAAIAGTVKDLKFINTTKAPVYIEGICSGGILTFTLYGEETRDPGREVIFESEVVSESAPQTVLQGSAAYDVGYVSVQQSSHEGKTAKLWKVVKQDGKEVSREEFNHSTYYASPKIITVGTRTNSEAARAMIQQAIASQNEGAIYTAAANAAAVAARPPEPEEPEEPENPEDPENPEKPEKPEKPDNSEKPDKDKTDDGKADAGKADTGKTDSGKKEDSKKDNKTEDSGKSDKKDSSKDSGKEQE